MTGCAVAYVPACRPGDARAAAPAGLRRAAGGAVDVLYLPPGAPGAPRDRLRAILAAHRCHDALLPLSPRRALCLGDALALAEQASDRLLRRLRAVEGLCELEILWEPRAHPGTGGCVPRARGAAWLRARAEALAQADRRCAALRAQAEGAGASALRCFAEQGRAHAVVASPRCAVEALCTSLREVARDPALSGGPLLVTGPWPPFTLAADVVAGDVVASAA